RPALLNEEGRVKNFPLLARGGVARSDGVVWLKAPGWWGFKPPQDHPFATIVASGPPRRGGQSQDLSPPRRGGVARSDGVVWLSAVRPSSAPLPPRSRIATIDRVMSSARI